MKRIIDNDNEALEFGASIADDVAKQPDINAHKDGDQYLQLNWFDDDSRRSVAKCAFYGRLEHLRETIAAQYGS